MNGQSSSAEAWLSRHSGLMVRCPSQPGNLLISRWACCKRRMKARHEDLRICARGDFLDDVYRAGLMRCLECPLSRSVSPDSDSREKGAAVAFRVARAGD